MPPKSAGGAGNGAPTSDDPRTNEWTTARQIISDIDGQLGTLRQYGFTFVAGLLSAQALIDFPPNTSSSFVPPAVRLAIVLASLALIGAIYVSDINLRSIQRDVALRAQEIERGFGMELTESVSSKVTRFSENSIVVIYILLAGVAGILGLAAVSPDKIDLSSWMFYMDIGATFAVVGGVVYTNFARVRDRLVAWSLDRYRCTQGDTIAVTLTNEGHGTLTPLENDSETTPDVLWRFEADPSGTQPPSTPRLARASGSDKADPLKGPPIPPGFALKPGEIRTWWWDTSRVEPGRSYTLHHVSLESSIPGRTKEIPNRRHRSIWIESRKPSSVEHKVDDDKAHSKLVLEEAVISESSPELGPARLGGEPTGLPEDYP